MILKKRYSQCIINEVKKKKKQKKKLVYNKGAVKEFIPLDQWESHFAHLSKTYYIST